MTITVNDRIHLSEFHAADTAALVALLNDREIYERTLRIPSPYTDTDAEEWLTLTARIAQQQGRPVHWAIRSADEALIGGCGLDDFQLGKSHRAEIGYWLARPLWGQGIMTAVVRRVCQHAFEEFGLARITAYVFPENWASARVLEKCGFQQEGYLRRHVVKDGKLLDARLFALLK